MYAPFPPASLTLFDLIIPCASDRIEMPELPTFVIVLFSIVKLGELYTQMPSCGQF